MSSSNLIAAAFLLASSAGLVAAQGGNAATATFTRDSVFPPVGLATTETIQINVLNTATNPAASTTSTAASCTGTITFSNATGATIGTATPFTIASGQVFSAKLPYSSSGTSTGRAEIVGSIQTTTTLPSKTPCALTFSLETFDTSSGVTHIFLGNTPATAAPQISFGHI
jgi:hypothetical protein